MDRMNDFELPEGIGESDLRLLREMLAEYSVPYPPDAVPDGMIETLRQYVPTKKSGFTRQAERMAVLLGAARGEINFVSPAFWAACTSLFVLGALVTIVSQINPYAVILCLAPLPFIIGLLELFRGRESGMLELELACRTSAREIVLSRLLITGVYSILLNSVLSIVSALLHPETNLWQLTLLWLTPLTLVSAVALGVATRLRGGYAVTFFLTTWMVFALSLQALPGFVDYMLKLNALVYLALIFSGAVLFIYELKKLAARYYPGLERWRHLELNG